MPCRSLSVFVAFACLLALPLAAAEEWGSAEWNARSALEAHRTATLSAETGGRVVRIRREMGEAFAQGDALIELDDRLPRAVLASAKAAREAAASVLAAAESMYERNSASQIERDEARRDAAEAEAKLERAILEVEACVIAAPFAGRIVEVLVREHELAEKGIPVVTIIDDSRLVAKFLFPEEKFGRVAIDDVLTIRIPIAGVTRPARVSHIAPVLDPASRTLDVWAAVDNADAALRAGMSAELVDDAEDEVR